MGCKESRPVGVQNDRPSMNPKNVNNMDRTHKRKEDNELKIVFLGNIASGKTLYYLKTKDHTIDFEDRTTGMPGVNVVKYLQTPKYGKIIAMLWDTACEESCFAITAKLVKRSNAVMLLYAIDNRETFDN
jgi:GTPase SAR1 family protein